VREVDAKPGREDGPAENAERKWPSELSGMMRVVGSHRMSWMLYWSMRSTVRSSIGIRSESRFLPFVDHTDVHGRAESLRQSAGVPYAP
jgi:hypothetical protein